MKKVLCILLTLVLVCGCFVGCSKNEPKNDLSNVGEIIGDVIDKAENETDDEEYNEDDWELVDKEDKDPVDIYSVELKENECISKDGIIFPKTMKLNGYEFMLRSKFEDFLTGTKSTIVNKNDYDAYVADVTRTGVLEVELTLPADEGRTEFEVGIRRDKDTGEILLRSINIMTDIKWITQDKKITEYDTHFPCGFEFLGVDIDKNRLSDLDEKYRSDQSDYFTKDDAKHFDMRLYTARDDWYEYTVSASTLSEDSDEYFFDYVIVESVNY